jgi:Holliday junction resolvase RusA-like endonuclease
MVLRFTVPGTPQSKGSRVQIRPGCNIEAGTKLSRARKKTWRQDVESAAAAAILTSSSVPGGAFPVTTPVTVQVIFHLPIAKTRLKGLKRIISGSLHAQKPDTDKLCRAILDPLVQAGAVKDDSIIAEIRCIKYWCLPGEERAEITLIW